LLENISKMISDAFSVISKYLGIWLYQTFCSRMVHHLCNFAHHKLYFPIFVLPYFSEQLLDDSFGNSGQTVLDPNSNPTATQPNFNQSNRIWLSLNPKRPDDDSVKEVSPPPKILGICTTISGHDLFASPINKNLGCP
jgi:hypothetical protein